MPPSSLSLSSLSPSKQTHLMQPPLRRPGDDVRVVRVAEHGAGFSEGRKSLVALLLLRRRRRCRLLPSTPRKGERERRTKGSDDEGGKKKKIPAAGRSFPPTVSSLSPMGLVSPPRPHNLFAWRQFLSPASLPPSSLLPRSKASLQRHFSTGRERAIGRSRLYAGRERSNNFSPRRIRFLFQLEFSRN